MRKTDTIAAIATGLTDSGIGIVRISGTDAVEVGNKIFKLPSGRRILSEAVSHMLYYGFAVDEGEDFVIDEVMAVVMASPRSFTGEDTVEIQCHGGVYVMKKILDTALKCGARLAEPGEFTRRAFLNGRMDLSMAEAVMDVIQSQNKYALAFSVNQLRGALSEKIRGLRSKVLYEIAFIESALDDPEHFSLEDYPEKLAEKLTVLADEIGGLIAASWNGRLIKEGIRTVIVGKPNAGKSSLLNCLVGEERAIVTEIAGTTRDALQETVRLGEIILNVVDTAGIRSTEDTVERIGVERARKYAGDADLILYVADASVSLDQNDREIVSLIKDKNVIVLLNKSDLENRVTAESMEELFQESGNPLQECGDPLRESGNPFQKSGNALQECENPFQESRKSLIIRTSAKDGEGMEELEESIKNMFFQGNIRSDHETVITNMRHKEALEEAYQSLMLVKKSIGEGLPEDFYSIDLMNAYSCLGRIIGEEVDDDLVEEIFSKFCMGK